MSLGNPAVVNAKKSVTRTEYIALASPKIDLVMEYALGVTNKSHTLIPRIALCTHHVIPAYSKR